ncbi:LptA/OstA family protein [Cereibacter johrii]|uniref:LptA/OstA family protein n=1 Tax=Cereibacter johrii TaxID=445629 RepID=UPI000C6E0CE8|nr:LptA/OstA family protein [Cereibacter johrii]MEA5159396.1 LptA/OstA family protein [Cereibacter johrii]QCP86913.1 lipopolysaccharide transport periplasmic protein LptA [Cereibacter sphaeroides]RAZ86535.1 lipopolysaccharide transport periplasmic protein LptA [Cereibacter johrii]RDS93920.1 lipopolysaccharide transport periplasmic protein LptA [Cereibacter sphaeroides f. sp. denitrificans]
MRTILMAAAAALWLPMAAHAQGAEVAFGGGLKQDTTLPVEIGSDQLQVNQSDGTAVFSGNVRVAQGPMRLGAQSVRVEYAPGGGAIRSLHASGGVTLANGSEAAEAKEAVYTIESGEVVMTGDVLLTQGPNTLAGQKLVIDLTAGTGRMEGRVQTVFQPGKAP